MSFSDWHEEPISKTHNRNDFDCGESALNEYLRRHARQNHERGAAKTILAIENADGDSILGYYSLSPASIECARVSEPARRGLGRYDVSGFRLGRLAVARTMQGRGLGGQLLLSAARRCILASAEVGGTVLLIDAKNDRVATWYASYGAVPLLDAPLSLLLPLAAVAPMLHAAGKL
jgi:GNAT superfamily N-acetyltransferase